jgi:hypothetical protein
VRLEQVDALGTTVYSANTETNFPTQIQAGYVAQNWKAWRDPTGTNEVSNPSVDSLTLITELKKTSESFDSSNTDVGATVASHATDFTAQTISSTSLTQHWKFRSYVQDQKGVRSDWTEYASGLTAFFEVPEKATIPSRARMQMFQVDGTTEIPSGGTCTSDLIRFKWWAVDPDPGNKLTIAADIRDVTLPLNGANAGSAGNKSAGTVEIAITPLSNGSSYHWQAMVWDDSGATSSVTDATDWMPYLAASESSGTGTAAFVVDF